MRIMTVDEEPNILKIVDISLAWWSYLADGFPNPVAA